MIFQLMANSNYVMLTLDGIIYFIPNDPANRHWEIYQAWLADGNEPLPAEE